MLITSLKDITVEVKSEIWIHVVIFTTYKAAVDFHSESNPALSLQTSAETHF